MTIQCWRFAGQGVHNDTHYEYFACGTNASFQLSGGVQLLYLDGENLGGGGFNYRTGTQSLSVVPDDTPTPGYQTFGNCTNCKNKVIFYDCINGNCTDKTQYNTPGIYKSLTDCQAVCANGGSCGDGKQCVDPTTFCPAGKVCIDDSEFSSIQNLISGINNEVC
ncbi:hypothetical protein [Nostoc sp.]|uniref:hypothetical protein n=1 Tax=Nostoc sp. TaxID=1180 RepID=UPI002FF80DCA